MSFSSLLIHPTGKRYDTQQLGRTNMIQPSASCMTSACNHSKTENYGKMLLLVSSQSVMQLLPNLHFLTTDLSFILKITAKIHFFSIKTDKVTWKTKKIEIFQEQKKTG